jgi:hypothetical protein
MANKVSSLTVQLIDDVSRPARSVEQAMSDAEKKVRAAAAAMGENSGATDRLVTSLAKLEGSKTDIEAVSRAWVDYTKVQGLAKDTTEWTKTQASDVRRWESQTVSALRAVMKERDAETAAMRRTVAEQKAIMKRQVEEQATQRRELARGVAGVAGGVGGGIAGAIVGGEVLEAIKKSAEAGITTDQRIAQLRAMGLTPDQINASRAEFREFSKQHSFRLNQENRESSDR